jgi:hypothetical protein
MLIYILCIIIYNVIMKVPQVPSEVPSRFFVQSKFAVTKQFTARKWQRRGKVAKCKVQSWQLAKPNFHIIYNKLTTILNVF